MAVVLDVHPADARLHRLIMLEHLSRREALGDQVAGVEDEHERRMIHLAVDLGEDQAVLADEVRFDLQAERQIGAMTSLDDLADLIDRLRHVRPGIGTPRMVKRKPAD